MKNIIAVGILAMLFPAVTLAEDVPLYIETDGELNFSGDILGGAGLAELLGSSQAVETFGTPNFIARDARTGVTQPVYTTPQEYELVKTGDGIIENRPDDLTFDETEGTDLREDLDFAANDGTDVSDDMTFSADDALRLPQAFVGPGDFFAGSRPDFLQPQHGIWAIGLTRSDAVGCPPGISELAIAQLTQTGARDVIFSEPGWVPADLNPDFTNYPWKSQGTNGFFSEPYRTDVKGSGMSLNVTMALDAKSERQIDVWAEINMKLSPALATMVGGSTSCVVTILGTYSKS